jgi:hypothetical protein
MLRVGNVALKFNAQDVTCFGVRYQQFKKDIDEYSCYLLVFRQRILQIPLKMQREIIWPSKNVLMIHRCREATPFVWYFGIQDAPASNFRPDTRYPTNIYVFFLSTCTHIPGC